MLTGKWPVHAKKDSQLSYEIMVKKDIREDKRKSLELLDTLDWNKTAVFSQATIGKKYEPDSEETLLVLTALSMYISIIYEDKDSPAKFFIANSRNDFGLIALMALLRFKKEHPDIMVITMSGEREHATILPLFTTMDSLEKHHFDSIGGIITGADHMLSTFIPDLQTLVFTKSNRIITDQDIVQFKPGDHPVHPVIKKYYRALRVQKEKTRIGDL